MNYEDEKSISMFIVATDGGGLQQSVKFLVKVKDVNDEAPVFALSEYQTYVEEKSTTLFPDITVLVSSRRF